MCDLANTLTWEIEGILFDLLFLLERVAFLHIRCKSSQFMILVSHGMKRFIFDLLYVTLFTDSKEINS